MLPRIFASLVLFSLIAFGLGCSSGPPAETQSRPNLNVLLVTVDTLRADYLGCYGRESVATPNFDELALRGALFSQAVVHTPLTLPSHASILTGTYPEIHEVRDNAGFTLKSDIPTLATLARDAGMETAAFIAAGVLNRRYGLNRGFSHYADDTSEERFQDKLPGIVAEIRADVVSNRALDWLQKAYERGTGREKGRNFLAWVHYYDPHFPYDPPEPYRSTYGADPYGGEVAYTDEQFGRLLKWLDQAGLRDNTLVIVMSDHGEGLGDHGEQTHGVFLYDSTMHIPLIAAGPGIRPSQTIDQQVRAIDIMPTVADFLELSAGELVQGQSLKQTLTLGRPVRATYAYLETLYPKTAMGWSELRGVRTDDWKLIVAPKEELYRIRTDRGERENLHGRFPEEEERLRKRVWEVAGMPGADNTLAKAPVDDRTRRELESLGYVSAGVQREIRLDMSGPNPKDRVEILRVLEDTAEMMNRDQFREAAALLQQALPKDPTNPMLYGQLGLCYRRTGQYARAIGLYRQAIAREIDTDQTHAELGELYVRTGDLPKAVEAMDISAQRNPANLQNLVNLATTYLQLSRIEEAERVAHSILLQNQRHGGAYNLLGIIAISRRQGDEARGHFEKAILYNPDLTEAYLNLGLLAQQAGQDQAAISYFEQFLQQAAGKPQHREIIPKVREAVAELRRN
jgi:arylsulfatase A-like enzyme/tetratricopeptide (TPR) repeat protein